MTASPEHQAEAKEQLPSVASIIIEAIKLVGKHAGEYYGFAGWLLVPLLLSIGAYATGGSVGSLLLNIASAGNFMLIMWCLAASILLTAAYTLHPDRTVDPRHLSMIAWERTFGLVITLFAGAILQLAGLFLLIIPGLIIGTYLTFASQEAVLHNHTFLRGLAASRELVRGRLGAILFRTLGLAAVAIIVSVAAGTIIVSVASAFDVLDPASLMTTLPPLWLQTLLSLIEIAIFPVLTAAHSLLYLAAKSR